MTPIPAIILALFPAAALSLAIHWMPFHGKARVIFAVFSAFAVLVRFYFFPVETSDYTDFLLPWAERLRSLGGFRGLGSAIGNYNVPYMVLLALFTYIKVPVLYLIKLSSVLSDILLSAVLALLAAKNGGKQFHSGICFLVALVLPTVFINSSVWGQCDSLYVALGLLGLYLCMTGRPWTGISCFSLSFAFKLQAVFLLPILFPLLLSGKLRLRHLPLFPAVYLLAVSPAVVAGANFRDVLLFYVHNASTAGTALNYNSASMYSLPFFYRIEDTGTAALAGIIAALALCLILCVFFILRREHITDRSLVLAAALFCCGIPLLLPHMHDRYFFFTDSLTLCMACLYPAAVPLVFLSQFASLLGYHAYFYLCYLLPMRYGFYGLVFIELAVFIVFIRELFSSVETVE